MPLRVTAARLLGLFRASRMARDLDDEMRDHIERATADYVARGMSPAEARAAAQSQFGSLLYVKDAHREVGVVTSIDNLTRDIRFAMRTSLGAPLFSGVVVVTLAVGIGATSAIFAIVNAVLLRPLPYPESHRLVQVSQVRRVSGQSTAVSPPNFFDIRERSRTVTGLAAYWSPTMKLSVGGGAPERVLGTLCTADLLKVIGVTPLLGRTFTEADDAVGAERVALVSHALWRRQFGGDSSVVGRKISIDDAPALIVGVMPDGFTFPARTEVWLPIRLSRTQPPNRAIPPEKYRQYRILSTVGRLAPGATIAQARAELTAVFAELERESPDTNRQMTAAATPLADAIVGDVRPALLLLFAAAGCLLLIASVNVATLLAVRTAARDRNLTVRLALGAGRGRLVQQLLVESVVLGIAGGGAGLLVAYALLGLLLRFAPPGIPRLGVAHIDAAVVVFTAALACVAGLLFGMAPALQAGRRPLVQSLKSGARSTSTPAQQRLRRTLVVVEIALSMVLLVSAGLLAQTAVRLGRVELGFRSSSAYAFDRFEMNRDATPGASSAFFRQLLATVRGIPGVDEAGLTIGVPLDPKGRFLIDDSAFTIENLASVTPGDRSTARMQVVSDGYFGAMGVPLVSGRAFEDRDREESPGAVIVNRTFADRYFPHGDAVGHFLNHELAIVPGQRMRRQIVGVVGNVRQFRLDEPYEPQIFLPHSQMPWPAMVLVVKTSLGAEQIVSAVRARVRALSSTIATPVPSEMHQVLNDALGPSRLRAWLIVVFAATALLLAAIGLYGTIAFAVQQRQRELAIRVVLGATPGQTSRLVVRDGLALSVVGTLLGGAAAWPATRLLSTLLFGVGAFDPATLVIVAGLLLAVSAAAAYLPARRVVRIDAARVVQSV